MKNLIWRTKRNQSVGLIGYLSSKLCLDFTWMGDHLGTPCASDMGWGIAGAFGWQYSAKYRLLIVGSMWVSISGSVTQSDTTSITKAH